LFPSALLVGLAALDAVSSGALDFYDFYSYFYALVLQPCIVALASGFPAAKDFSFNRHRELL
jgi:hypothetical protein